MKIEVIGVCPFCGKAHSVFADEMGVMAWQGGELIQNALPMLTPTEREQMISGICPKCQGGIFDEDEDENPKFQLVYEDEGGIMYELDGDLSDDNFFDLISDL